MAEKATSILKSLMFRVEGWAGHCVWCGCTIVAVGLVPEGLLVEIRRDHKAVLRIRGYTHVVNVASADHYIERSQGGRSIPGNILPSCRRCNTRRSR